MTLNAKAGKCQHPVKFYETDDALVDTVSSYVASAFEREATALIIATPGHQRAIDKALTKRGFDLPAFRARGQYVTLDAAATLATFMVDGCPDEKLFEATIGQLVGATLKGRPALCAFGEMVSLLVADKNPSAAVRLEELWNDLQKRHPFSLLCAYPMHLFSHEGASAPFARICEQHTQVLPSEGFSTEHSDDAQSRTIALLQQKAARLEVEIAQRKEVEAQLRDFLDNAGEAIHQVSADGRIMWANRAELELLGYTAEEFVGRPVADIHADADVIEDILNRLKSGEKLCNYEARLKHKDGSIRHVLINSSVYWKDGEFVYTKCFSRDITDRKNAQISNNLLSAIVESSDDAIVSKDLNGIITSWNKGAQRVFGYTAAEAVGRSITMLIPEERLDEEPRILQRIRSGERVDHFETVRRRKDGTLLHISLTISPIRDGNGKIIGASKVARDITERVRAKEELEQTVAERTAALRDVVSELEAFSYSIAHDMRAPLRAMHGYSRLLEEDYSQALPEDARQFLRKISASAARMDSLITDVLHYSKISRSEMPITTIDVEMLAYDVIDSYPHFRESGAAILIDSPIPPVLGNAAALTQCFSNLLSNAIKFTRPGVAPRVRIRAETAPGVVRIWVEDNGIGIAQKDIPKIFAMFQRLNPAHTFEGTGIGLTIVRKAVERMGGRVGVESQVGVGSRFWMELPAAA